MYTSSIFVQDKSTCKLIDNCIQFDLALK